ncbi:polysaccharide deacetylase family protein [Actinocorallia sp. A-T 12471]|uniref:polysaccharide deacetylase family protein n=1 Tax=Actinocorallia sp. A-T 12471 TaxID=3089813 RepID=UPI0029CDB0DB|nr:polysaccharide deacetylase family protein [Actinocorallia sp. A-T 12471]MDX6739869.1 polysaccharide deacetylase family protein [Actinocorallia sp. A-T 12471]
MTARLTLSFDNGPDPDVTPFVLRELAARGLSATFFPVGDQLRKPGGRELLAEVAAAGHVIGNHSMTHTVPLGESPGWETVGREIADMQDLLGDLAGDEKLFRPFGGGGRLGPHLFSPEAVQYLVAERYTVALWNSVPRDWEDPDGWSERARRDVQRRPWTLLVLHDIVKEAMEHLPAFLDGVLADGVEITAELPPECVPVCRGEVTGDLGPLVAGG